MDADFWRRSAVGLGGLLAGRELSPVELLDATLARIARLNPAINAIVALDEAGARAAAAASERRHARGEALGPLDGVPLTVKDNILVKGFPAAWGSALFRDYVPEGDELPVARLRAAGAVILGKTNVPEFTLQGYTANRIFGVTRNPWDPRLTPGGSSGGAVASVAAGLAPLALGTDGGGSIRRPASHTGLVGLKPSIGRVARVNSLPQILLDFEVIGPIARSVADAALLLRHMAGPDPRDRNSLLAVPAASPDAAPDRPPGRQRIRFVPRFGDNPVDPEIARSVADAARLFAELGHEVTEGPAPFDLEPLNELWRVVGCAAVAWLLDRHPGREAEIGPGFAEMAEEGRRTDSGRYLEMLMRVSRFRCEMSELFKETDIVMTPSAAALPWPAEESHPPVIDGRPVGPRGHAVFTAWVNICGHPGLNLPCAPARGSGLPIGFQLVGRFGADELLLRLGAQYEAARPWADRWPALAG